MAETFQQAGAAHAPTAEQPTLTVETPRRTFEVPLENSSIMIGRGPDNDLPLDESTVSLHHALVRRRGDRWEIVDLHSRNGTTHNQRSVEEALLEDGDTIELA